MKINNRVFLVLNAKEQRYHYETAVAQNHFCYLTVTLNIPNQRRLTNLALMFFNNFALKILEDFFQTAAISYQIIVIKHDYAGIYGLIALLKQVNLHDLKLQLLQLEASNQAFQVVDYDLYDNQQQKLSRQNFSVPPRKCYLCHQPALVCHRLQQHSQSAIFDQIDQLMKTAINNQVDNEITQLISC